MQAIIGLLVFAEAHLGCRMVFAAPGDAALLFCGGDI